MSSPPPSPPPSSCVPPALPPVHRPHHRIDRLTIKGSAYFEDTTFELSDGLNSVIGPVGAGKSTFLHSIRYSLGVAATGDHAEDNEKQATDTLGNGELTTEVCTQHGQGYGCQRKRNQPPRVTTTANVPAAVSLDGDLFKIDFYSQNEIYRITDKPAAQLALIDKFAEAEIRAHDVTIAEVERRLGANATEVARLEEAIAEGVIRTADLPSVEAALQALHQAGGADAAEAQQAHEAKLVRGREQQMLRTLRDDQHAIFTAAEALEGNARRRLGADLPPPLAASVNHPLLAPAHAEAKLVLATITEAVDQIRRALTRAGVALTTAGDTVAAAHAAQDAAYDAIVRRLDADRARVAERERLQKQFLTLEAARKGLEDARLARDARLAERSALLEERARALAARHAVRLRIAGEINVELEGVLSVDIVASGDVAAYRTLLYALLKGANIRPQALIDRIASRIRPDDLAALVRSKETGPIEALDESADGHAERAQKILDVLRATGRVAELETVHVGDLPLITFLDGEHKIPASTLSIGQRCIAVLPIILLHSASILIIDQPEDALDNAFISRVLVPTLLKLRFSRQIIFASHNPNIIVLAESAKVFAVESVNRRGRLKASGTLNEMRALVEKQVEGGSDAFLLRSKCYGHTLV